MVNPSALDELSRLLYHEIIRRYPDWEAFATVPADSNQTILFEIPRPAKDRNLRIDTMDGEIFLGFDEWHTHSDLWGELDTPGNFSRVVDATIDWIQRIVSEQSFVVVWSKDGQPAGSSLLESGEVVTPFSGSVAIVYSWLGTHDRVIGP